MAVATIIVVVIAIFLPSGRAAITAARATNPDATPEEADVVTDDTPRPMSDEQVSDR